MQSKYLLRKNSECGDWSGCKRDCWEWRWKNEREREGENIERKWIKRKGAKRRSCRVDRRDVTELIIGFCRDLAQSAFFCWHAHLYISPSVTLSSFAANVRVAFNPERPHPQTKCARCNFPSLVSCIFHSSLSRFDFFRHPFYIIGK